jgi:hypothetical protein
MPVDQTRVHEGGRPPPRGPPGSFGVEGSGGSALSPSAEEFIGVTPSPRLTRCGGLNDGVAGAGGMSRGVSRSRGVTAADVSACQAGAEVHYEPVLRPVVFARGGRADVPRRGRDEVLARIRRRCRPSGAQPLPEGTQGPVSTLVLASVVDSTVASCHDVRLPLSRRTLPRCRRRAAPSAGVDQRVKRQGTWPPSGAGTVPARIPPTRPATGRQAFRLPPGRP